jgi:hypothetical protein
MRLARRFAVTAGALCLTACVTGVPQTVPAPNTPSDAITASATKPVRVRLKAGGQFRLLGISVVGDSLIGHQRDGIRQAFPVADIKDLIVEKLDPTATAVALLLLFLGYIVAAVVFGGFGG